MMETPGDGFVHDAWPAVAVRSIAGDAGTRPLGLADNLDRSRCRVRGRLERDSRPFGVEGTKKPNDASARHDDVFPLL